VWTARLIGGIILVLLLLVLVLWLRRRHIVVTWYEYLLGSLGLLLLLFAIECIVGSIFEQQTVAALNSFYIFGLPAIIFLVIAVGLPVRRNLKKQ